MQTHAREFLLLILDSATGTNVRALEPHAAWGSQAGLFQAFVVVDSSGCGFLFFVFWFFFPFSFIIFCSFFFFLPSPIKKRTLLKP